MNELVLLLQTQKLFMGFNIVVTNELNLTYDCLDHARLLDSKSLDSLKDIHSALCLAALNAVDQGTEHTTSAYGVTTCGEKNFRFTN